VIRKEPNWRVKLVLRGPPHGWMFENRTNGKLVCLFPPDDADPRRIGGPYRGDQTDGGAWLWAFNGEVYSTKADLDEEEFEALLFEAANATKVRIARAMALKAQAQAIEGAEDSGRPLIPDDVKMYVWQRDGGKCVKCRSTRNLEYDHDIPFSLGGSTTARNLRLLCETCNRSKGGSLL